MKKISIIVLLCVVTIGLAACGADTASQKIADDSTPPTSDSSENPVSDGAEDEDAGNSETPEKTESAPKTVTSNTLNTCQIEVDGQILKFPMKYSELEKLGFVAQDDITAELPPSGSAMPEIIKVMRGKFPAHVQVENDGAEPIPFKDGIITKFTSYENYANDAGDAKVILPDGVKLRESTRDEVLAIYGEPTETDETAMENVLIYEFESDGNECNYELNFRDGGEENFCNFILSVKKIPA